MHNFTCVSNDSFCVEYNSVCGVKHWVFASVAMCLKLVFIILHPELPDERSSL